MATGRFATDRLASNWGGWEEMERGAAADVPAGRLGQPDEYGDLVAFLCSERAAYVTGTSSRSTAVSCARSERRLSRC